MPDNDCGPDCAAHGRICYHVFALALPIVNTESTYSPKSMDPVCHFYRFVDNMAIHYGYWATPTSVHGSYLDLAKRIFINVSYWGCIWLVFLGSVNRVNIFSIIYLCYVFIYLWHGLNIYYKPLPLVLKYWNHLIVQNVLIICIKTGLQVIGCFYMPDIPMEYCGFIKLFGIGCVRNFESTDYFEKLNEGKTICRASQSEMSGIEWDAAIFYFLMIQRRVFCSYNFFHIINDAKAQHILSTRGANILDKLFDKRIKDIKDEERRIRQAVESKLTRLLNNKKRIQGEYYNKNIVTHKMAIRAGDYYMYDDNETDVEEEGTFKQKEEEKLAKQKAQRHNLFSLFGDMINSNMRTAVLNYWDTTGKKNAKRKEDDEPYGITTRIVYLLKFCWAVMNVLMVMATEFFGKYTKTYDMVRDELNKERRQLKEQTDYDVGVRVEGWWLPRASFEDLIKNSRLQKPKRPPKEMSTTDLPDFLKLLKALWIITVARSDLLCYVCVIMNQVMQCQLITIPLISMVYMWGTLSNPRPSKTFWIIMIGYVEMVIFLKCIFQFDMMPGNSLPNVHNEDDPMKSVNPFFPSKFMGLLAMEKYYIWEMFILIAIVIHRYYLTNIGLWSTVTTSISASGTDGLYTMKNGALVRTSPLKPTTSAASNNEYVIFSIRTSTLDNLLLSIKTILFHYAISFRQFHQRLLYHVHQEAHDYYALMFFFDLLALAVVASTFPVFSEYEPKDTVWTYLSTSVIPVRYVSVVLVHCINILVDRAIYLQKSLVLKLVYHVLQFLSVHIWLFVMIPHFISGRMVSERPEIMAYYIFRCIYNLISAQQIRVGYPSRIWGFYCCHSFGLWNYIQIKAYLAIPFLFELRSSFDWAFTDTTMSIFDWCRMEDIYTNVYMVKCLRGIEEEYCGPRAVKKKLIYKYFYGMSLLIFFLVIIWFPIMVYSWGREAGQSNPPSSATMRLQIGDVTAIYENRANVYKMTFTEYESVKKVYNAYDISKEFLDNYVNTDVAALTFRTGGATWMIRQQELRKMIRIIHGAHPVPVVMTCDIILPGDNNKELSLSVRKMMFPYSFTRQSMAKLMIGEKVERPVTIEYLLPKFLKIEQRGKVSMVNLLMHPEGTEDAGTRQRNITFNSILATDGNGRVWWDLSEEIDDENFSKFLGKIPYASGSDGNMAIITFSDKVVHSFFSMVTGGSIITFYSLFLFIIHGWSRDLISFRMGRIWLYEVPQADVLYALCKEVYICREANMWELEEVAAARVFFMIRSGDTALKLSRFHGSPYNPNTNKTMPPVTRRS